MRTLDQLRKLVPEGPVLIVHLGLNGPYQLQAGRVNIATVLRPEVAEYLARLWNYAKDWRTMSTDDSPGGPAGQERSIQNYYPRVLAEPGPPESILQTPETTRPPRLRRKSGRSPE